MEDWDFAGWGKASRIDDLGSEPIRQRELGVPVERSHRLGVWRATAICGNDITSSCLYVSALTIVAAGAFALLGLFAVLNLIGITESATVVLGISVLHMATLTLLSIGGIFTVLQDPQSLGGVRLII